MIIRSKFFSIPFLIEGRELREGLTWGGWGNGYVAISPNHPLYGKSYDESNNELQCNVDLTYANYASRLRIPKKYNVPEKWWTFGFDTFHYDMNMDNWNMNRVLEETLILKKLLDDYK